MRGAEGERERDRGDSERGGRPDEGGTAERKVVREKDKVRKRKGEKEDMKKKTCGGERRKRGSM